MSKRLEERNKAIFDYLTSVDSEGFSPSYEACASAFKLTRQRVAQIFRREWQERAVAGQEEPLVRDTRFAPMSDDQFREKYGEVIDLFVQGKSIDEVSSATSIARSTARWVYVRCEGLGLVPDLRASRRMWRLRLRRHEPPVFTPEGVLM